MLLRNVSKVTRPSNDRGKLSIEVGVTHSIVYSGSLCIVRVRVCACAEPEGETQMVSSAAIHLVFCNRISHWPGTHQVGEGLTNLAQSPSLSSSAPDLQARASTTGPFTCCRFQFWSLCLQDKHSMS